MRTRSIITAASILSTLNVLSAEPTDTIAAGSLGEVTVTGSAARQRLASTQIGAEQLELSRLARLPAMFGENDLIRSISLMPGVHGEGDGAGGFEVRGGTSSQNLVRLDGITLYNPSHVMGIFSTFNDNAVGRATLYKGPIPSEYGGATASVLETSLANGDLEKYDASATIGILAAKVMASGPVVKDRLSFAATARRSYVDAFLQMVPQYRSTVMNFYDVTAKLHYTPRRGDHLDVSFIAGRDNMAIKRVMGMYWGNVGASVDWLTRRGERLVFATTGSFTNYSPDMRMSMAGTDQKLTEYVRNFSLTEKVGITLSDSHRLEAGLSSELLRVKSAEMEYGDHRELDIRSGWENSVWVAYDGTFAERFSVASGVRLNLYSVMSGRPFRKFEAMAEPTPDYRPENYFSVEPRISLKYDITQLHNIKAGFGLSSQNLHAIRSSSTSFPFDRYALTSNVVKPERAVQYGIGYAGMTADGMFDWSAEGYYKSLRNVYDYQDGRTMFSQVNIESIILGGRGRSYGLEFMFRKNVGRLTGWISYTLSRTRTRIPGINDGRWYDASNDRRHDLSLAAVFRLSDRWSLSGSWIFSSGQPLTAPDVKYELDGTTCYYYSQRNGYRTPPVHRLDLSATWTRPGRHFDTQWSFGIYNAYCRYNPYIVYFEDDPSKPSGTRVVQQSLFGLVPSISYTIKL